MEKSKDPFYTGVNDLEKGQEKAPGSYCCLMTHCKKRSAN